MSHPSIDPNRPAMPGTDPAQSVLVRLARDAFAQTGSGFTWPELDLADPEVRRFGDYDLVEQLGRGGMGVVYRARQGSLDREVALKFIHGVADDPEAVQRFLAEARIAARLNHPGIVPVYEVGSVGELHYISMPLIGGRTLAERLERDAMSMDESLRLTLQLCDAMDYAHRLGLLHLDLKPANILLDDRGGALIADFGLARRMDESGGVDAQEVSGTPAYMAPEQVLIKQYRLTAATDIYALGAVLFEMLGGVSPHGRGQPDVVTRRALAGRLESLAALRPGISPDLIAICSRCLELEPAERYPSVAAVGEDLRRFRDGLPVSVRAPGLVERTRRWLQREPRLAAAVALTFVAVTVGTFATYRESLASDAERTVAVQQRDAAEVARAAEAAQRVRAEHATALGARLFVRARDLQDTSEAANEVLRWLRERLPDDEAMQAEVLTDFATALDANESRGQVQNLLYQVMSVMGGEYRGLILDQLERSNEPVDQLYAAMLAWRDIENDEQRARFRTLLDRALKSNPDSSFAWYVAATYCVDGGDEACPRRDAAEQLVRLDPDNRFSWVVLAGASEGDAAYAALREAAARGKLHDYYVANYMAFARAIEHSNVAVPRLLADLAGVLSPQESVESTVAQVEAWSLPSPHFARFVDLCHPQRGMPEDPAVRADCVAIAEAMARGRNSLVTNMVGSAVVRRLAPATPLADEMRALRARYVYLSELYFQMTHEQLLSYPLERFEHDMLEHGELEAMARRIEFHGLPSHPPEGWSPKDPMTLLLPEERTRR